MIKCDLDCLVSNEGVCNIGVPTSLNRVKPNSTECEFYSNDFESEKAWLKKEGGMMNVILKKLNRYKGDEDVKR